MLKLRTAEGVFAVVDFSREMGATYRDVRAYATKLRRNRAWNTATQLCRQVRSSKVKRTTFRVVAQMQGRHGFRRVDAQRAVKEVVAARFPS